MENITIGQVISAITCISVFSGFVVAIFKFYKSNFSDRFNNLDERVSTLEERVGQQEDEMKESVEERLMLLRGLLACLEGLQQGGANGPVTKAIGEIKEYLINKTHHN